MIHPVAGLLALMDRADAAGVPMVAVTNAPRLNAELLLGGIGITDRFVAVVIGEELAHGKPHPLPYLEGLRLAGADPALSVAFEDSRSGITSATTAGLPVYGIRTSLSPEQMAEAGAVQFCATISPMQGLLALRGGARAGLAAVATPPSPSPARPCRTASAHGRSRTSRNTGLAGGSVPKISDTPSSPSTSFAASRPAPSAMARKRAACGSFTSMAPPCSSMPVT